MSETFGLGFCILRHYFNQFHKLRACRKTALVPAALFLCWAASHCDESAPHLLLKIQPEQPHRFGTLQLACSVQTPEHFSRRGIASAPRPESPKKKGWPRRGQPFCNQTLRSERKVDADKRVVQVHRAIVQIPVIRR